MGVGDVVAVGALVVEVDEGGVGTALIDVDEGRVAPSGSSPRGRPRGLEPIDDEVGGYALACDDKGVVDGGGGIPGDLPRAVPCGDGRGGHAGALEVGLNVLQREEDLAPCPI